MGSVTINNRKERIYQKKLEQELVDKETRMIKEKKPKVTIYDYPLEGELAALSGHVPRGCGGLLSSCGTLTSRARTKGVYCA